MATKTWIIHPPFLGTSPPIFRTPPFYGLKKYDKKSLKKSIYIHHGGLGGVVIIFSAGGDELCSPNLAAPAEPG